MTTPVNHLKELAVFQIDFDIWSGQVKLEDPDIKLGIGGEIPPKDLVDLGRKKVISSIHLRPFSRLKSKARRLCLAHGMLFMNGFVIPLNKIDSICSDLDKIAVEMKDIKAHFLDNYDQWISDWMNKNPEYASAIGGGVLPKAVVEKRMGFDYQVFQVNPVNEVQSNKLNTMAGGLAGDLMDEIVSDADKFFHSSLKGKDRCQVNTQKTLKGLLDKVDGLSFLDRRFLTVVELLNNCITDYAGVGKSISGEPFYRVLSAILILSSRDKIEEYASGKLNINEMATNFIAAGSDDFLLEDDIKTENVEDTNISLPDVLIDKSLPDLVLPDEDDIDQYFQNHVDNSESIFF